MDEEALIKWLLEGDVAIQCQVHRDLLSRERPDLRKRIATEGWGSMFLAQRKPEGHWGRGFYQPKWISSHYTLLDYFRSAGLPRDERMQPAIGVLLKKRRKDGTWPLQAKHPGKVHFDMEQAGMPSRWNTLRALRVLKYFEKVAASFD